MKQVLESLRNPAGSYFESGGVKQILKALRNPAGNISEPGDLKQILESLRRSAGRHFGARWPGIHLVSSREACWKPF